MTTVLVAYATMAGGTGEIAGWIAEELRAAGLDVRLAPAGEVQDVAGCDALVLGGALYAGGWHADARRFANRFAGQFDGRPVWLFSSGPLDDSTDHTQPPPPPQIEAAMRSLGARGQMAFGGRMSVEAHGWMGFVARRMTREDHGGDFRNPERVRAWARELAADLT